MTLDEAKKLPATQRYKILDNFWWDGEGMLACLLPKSEEATAIYGEFQNLRYRIHDLLSAESRQNPLDKHPES
jgi:hypothetical protein